MEEAKGFQKKFDLKTTRNALAVGKFVDAITGLGPKGQDCRVPLAVE